MLVAFMHVLLAFLYFAAIAHNRSFARLHSDSDARDAELMAAPGRVYCSWRITTPYLSGYVVVSPLTRARCGLHRLHSAPRGLRAVRRVFTARWCSLSFGFGAEPHLGF